MPSRGAVVMLCALALLTIGVVMVSSAAMQVEPIGVVVDDENPATAPPITVESMLTGKPAQHMALAVLAMIVAALTPWRVLLGRFKAMESRPRRMLCLGAAALVAVLVLVYVPGIRKPENGSYRWIRMPGLESLQPSELAKWGIVLLLAWYAGTMTRERIAKWSGLMPACLALGAVSLLVLKEDLGTGLLIGVAGMVLLVAGGARLAHLGLFVPVGLLAVFLGIWTSAYRQDRILAFLEPYKHAKDDSYQMIQSLASIAGGGPFGRGLGHGIQKFGYLPEDTTDFLFAIICEETGIFGAGLVIALLGLLIWNLHAIASRARTQFAALLCVGVSATIGVQAVINLLVVTGLAPTKGIALPLLSSGGTGWIATGFMIGVIASIDRDSEPIAVHERPVDRQVRPAAAG